MSPLIATPTRSACTMTYPSPPAHRDCCGKELITIFPPLDLRFCFHLLSLLEVDIILLVQPFLNELPYYDALA